MISFIKRLLADTNNTAVNQFLRYLIVGGIAAGLDICIFYFTSNMLNFHHYIANTLSFVAGLLVNYFLSRSWVFNGQNNQFTRDFLLFALIGVLGLILSNIILFILIDCKLMYIFLPMLSDHLVKLTAKMNAVFIVLFWNFIARKKIVFRNA